MSRNNATYPGLVKYIMTTDEEGELSFDAMYQKARSEFDYRGEFKTFRNYIYKLRARSNSSQFEVPVTNEIESDDKAIQDEIISRLKNKKLLDIFDLCDELKTLPNDLTKYIHQLRDLGHEIIWQDNQIWMGDGLVGDAPMIERIDDGKELTIGVMSDLHFGSRSCQITAMNLFADECRKHDVENIFVPGDVTAGFGIYKGQTMELYEQSAEHQEESCIANLPEGFKYYMIGGNHDYSFMKIAGHNIIRSMCSRRKEFIYCGFDWSEFELLPDVSVGLWHPSGGIPYSSSYRLQKGVEQLAFEELANICSGKKSKPTLRGVFAGHLHIQLQALFGSILGMQCGCFEGSNSYLKAKKLVPAIGGYILHVKIGRNGLLQKFSPTFYLYPEILNDWKNYNHKIDKHEVIPVPFKW